MFKKLLKKWRYFLSVFVFSSSVEAIHASIIKQEFIFEKAPFKSCHASTLTQTNTGAILCSWFGGSAEGEKDVAIWSSTLAQAEWSAPQKIAEAKEVPCWNPVLFTLPSNEILLFYKAGRNPQQWSAFLKRSLDEGKTWSAAEDLPAGVIGPVKNRPLLLADGTLLCGSSIESWKRWGCWMDLTADCGRTWSKSAPINVPSELFGIIQPTIFPSKNNTIRLLARSHEIGFICTSISADQGKTWSPAKPTTLPNPNSSVDAIALTDGRVVLVYNPDKEERSPLSVAVSLDGGETWELKMNLETKPGEYSYPAIIQANDGKIHITYTWNRKKIKYVVLDPNF